VFYFIDDIILLMLKLVSNKIDTYLTSLWRHERYFFFCISWNFAHKYNYLQKQVIYWWISLLEMNHTMYRDCVYIHNGIIYTIRRVKILILRVFTNLIVIFTNFQKIYLSVRLCALWRHNDIMIRRIMLKMDYKIYFLKICKYNN
jgi:hypothetical protein